MLLSYVSALFAAAKLSYWELELHVAYFEYVGIDISVAGILIYLYSLLNLNNKKRIVCFVMVEIYDIMIGHTYQKMILALVICTRKA